MHGGIPARVLFYARGLVAMMLYQRYNEEAGDFIHLLINCPYSMAACDALKGQIDVNVSSLQPNLWLQVLQGRG